MKILTMCICKISFSINLVLILLIRASIFFPFLSCVLNLCSLFFNSFPCHSFICKTTMPVIISLVISFSDIKFVINVTSCGFMRYMLTSKVITLSRADTVSLRSIFHAFQFENKHGSNLKDFQRDRLPGPRKLGLKATFLHFPRNMVLLYPFSNRFCVKTIALLSK